MFKFLLRCLTTVWLGISLLVIYNVITNKNSGFERLPFAEKFGTAPDSNAYIMPIVHLADKNKKSFCTAFVIDANFAVTAAHCINSTGHLPKETLKLLNEAGEEVADAQAVGYHDRSDLGLLKGSFNKFKALQSEFYTHGLQIKKLYYACGYPHGQKKLACNYFSTNDNEMFAVRGHGFLIPGMSGGPVVDSDTGIAVGVNYAVSDGYSLVNPLQGIMGIFDL